MRDFMLFLFYLSLSPLSRYVFVARLIIDVRFATTPNAIQMLT